LLAAVRIGALMDVLIPSPMANSSVELTLEQIYWNSSVGFLDDSKITSSNAFFELDNSPLQ
jgi:hypothetical protein